MVMDILSFKFIHNSFMEYFVACTIVEKLYEVKEKDYALINGILDRSFISSEIALFINDILDSSKYKKKELVIVLEKMLDNVNGNVRENIITILSKTAHNMKNVIMDGANYIKSDFSYAKISDVTIKNVDFSGAVFYRATIKNVNFVNCRFNNSHFNKSILHNVDFSNQSLEIADISYSEIEECIFSNSVLVEAKMSRSNVKKCDFKDCDMSGIEVVGTVFENNFNYKNAIGVPYDIK